MDDDEELISTIESRFDVSLQPAELAKTETFGQLCDVVVAAMNRTRPAIPYAFAQFWPAIQEIAAEDDITPVTRFSDLNV